MQGNVGNMYVCVHAQILLPFHLFVFIVLCVRSNFHRPDTTTVMRWERGESERQERVAPVLFADYNKHMGGTDLCDQRRGNFTTQRRSKKWWHALFYFTLDVLMAGMWFVVTCKVCVCASVGSSGGWGSPAIPPE